MLVIALLAGFCLLSAFITFGLGIFVYTKNPSSAVNRIFLAMLIAATYWAVGEFMIWRSADIGEALFWLKASSFWPLVIVLCVHFILAFTDHPVAARKNLPVLALVLYLPAFIISFIGIATDTIYRVSFLPGTGYIYLPAEGSLVYLAEAAYCTAVMLAAAAIVFRSWQRARPGRVRRRYGLVGIGLTVVIVTGFLSGVLLPGYHLFLPNLVFVGIVVFSLLITWAIVRYGLFTLSPETALPDILRLMPDGVILSDTAGKILASNRSAARIFGVPEDDLPGRLLSAYIPAPAFTSTIAAVTSEGILENLEIDLERQSPGTISIAGAMIHDPDGDPAGIVLIVRDITGRRQNERALRVANEKISLLSRLTRHDIGNLVTALWGNLELLKANLGRPSGEKYADRCIDIVKKIASHLRFSRELQDTSSYNPLWQPAGAMIAKAADELPHEGVAIDLEAEPVEIFTDPLVFKVIYNLLDNAIRHGEHTTRIRVSTGKRPGGELVLVIEDNGTGVPAGNKEQIFQAGFAKHTGLGLSLSRDILALTGITIRETGVPGAGARFEITVPKGGWRAAA